MIKPQVLQMLNTFEVIILIQMGRLGHRRSTRTSLIQSFCKKFGSKDRYSLGLAVLCVQQEYIRYCKVSKRLFKSMS